MEKTQKYSKPWSTKHPGLQFYLVDQSRSMGEKYPGFSSKAACAAASINNCTNEILLANSMGFNRPKPVGRIVMIGYGGRGGDSVVCIREGDFTEYANHPLRYEKTPRRVSNGDRGMVEIEEEIPVYLESLYCGSTAMGGAFQMAGDMIEKYVYENPDCPAPWVFNVSDGSPWTNQRKHGEIDYTIAQVERLMAIETTDGAPLVFNAHIGTGQPQCICPSNYNSLYDLQSKFLFKISSIIPEFLRKTACKLGFDFDDQARLFVSNASAEVFTKFINLGSSGAMRDRMSA